MSRVRLLLFLIPLAAIGCVAQPPARDAGPCPVADAGGWRAWIDLMPGPDRPRLWVVGNVNAPTGGWRVWLERGPVQEIDPPVQQVIVRARAPSGGATQAIVKHELSASFPAASDYGGVTVYCGSQLLTQIERVEKAH